MGRESKQLPLTDNTVSRRHAELLPSDGVWVLHDLGSSNGSYVNGARVTNKYTLKLGDQIRVGRTLMVFGAQPGVTRVGGKEVNLAGAEAGMDSAIVAALPSNEDSMVLAVPETRRGRDEQPPRAVPAQRAARRELQRATGPRSRDGPRLRARKSRPRHHADAGRPRRRTPPRRRARA